jgi:hypothetical protein
MEAVADVQRGHGRWRQVGTRPVHAAVGNIHTHVSPRRFVTTQFLCFLFMFIRIWRDRHGARCVLTQTSPWQLCRIY